MNIEEQVELISIYIEMFVNGLVPEEMQVVYTFDTLEELLKSKTWEGLSFANVDEDKKFEFLKDLHSTTLSKEIFKESEKGNCEISVTDKGGIVPIPKKEDMSTMQFMRYLTYNIKQRKDQGL